MSQVDERYYLSISVWALVSRALVEMNDAMTWRKLVDHTEDVVRLQRTIAAANVMAQEWKDRLAVDFDAADREMA